MGRFPKNASLVGEMIMVKFKEVIDSTTFAEVKKEMEKCYAERVRKVYEALKTSSPLNKDALILSITAWDEQTDESIPLDKFDVNDSNVILDVSGRSCDNEDGDELYSIASSNYSELLSYYVDSETAKNFNYAQIIAQILWELEW